MLAYVYVLVCVRASERINQKWYVERRGWYELNNTNNNTSDATRKKTAPMLAFDLRFSRWTQTHMHTGSSAVTRYSVHSRSIQSLLKTNSCTGYACSSSTPMLLSFFFCFFVNSSCFFFISNLFYGSALISLLHLINDSVSIYSVWFCFSFSFLLVVFFGFAGRLSLVVACTFVFSSFFIILFSFSLNV